MQASPSLSPKSELQQENVAPNPAMTSTLEPERGSQAEEQAAAAAAEERVASSSEVRAPHGDVLPEEPELPSTALEESKHAEAMDSDDVPLVQEAKPEAQTPVKLEPAPVSHKAASSPTNHPQYSHDNQQQQQHNGSPSSKPSAATPSATPAAAPSEASPAKAAKAASAINATGSRRQLGEWTLGKTLGAGSMGKVKLAVSVESGEKAAVKVIPRFTSVAAVKQHAAQQAAADKRHQQLQAARAEGHHEEGSSTMPAQSPEAASAKDAGPSPEEMTKARQKDLSKEVRTIREASIQMLLHHPYVCGMKSMHVYPNHYYMVCEWIHGGQMLDYIIAHGRLRERSARKFARQICSALEYCHANNIVHRDLKIENILISKTGNIKIIDFGLSNVYSPHSHLSTFCGSLYFAAPELLNAKPYTGPEVDVWSLGVVLYVLVCGKVPFDDQSMPALHAKIKRGLVEYPTWLSPECKHLLSRFLITNPTARATMNEVRVHPWMCKGYDGAPSSHLPPREPLQVSDLEWDVIQDMAGFDFGTPYEIEAKLHELLTSNTYQACLNAYEERRMKSVMGSEVALSPTGGISSSGSLSGPRSPHSKRFSTGLDFYRKKISGQMHAVLGGKHDEDGHQPSHHHSSGGDGSAHYYSGLVTASGSRPDQLDPTKGYHPLLSIYYLVKEKHEREKVFGPGVFASSTLSLHGPPLPPAPAQAHHAAVTPSSPDPFVQSPPPSASHRMPIPSSLNAPPATTTPPRVPAKDAMPQVMADDAGRPLSASASRRVSRVPASAPTTPHMHNGFATAPANAHLPPPSSPSPSPAPGRQSVQLSDTQAEASDDAPLSPGGALARRFGSLIGRATSLNDGQQSQAQRQQAQHQRHRSSISGPGHRLDGKGPATHLPQVSEQMSGLGLGTPTRASTLHAGNGNNRHARGVSVGTATTSANSSLVRSISLGGHRGPRQSSSEQRPMTSDGGTAMGGETLDEAAEEEVLDDQEPVTASEGMTPPQSVTHKSAAGVTGSPGVFAPNEEPKPVYLKGLFSVATTSTKPPAQIRQELQRVLERLGVASRPVKSGFECAHAPSIDLRSVNSPQAQGHLSQANLHAPESAVKPRPSREDNKDLPSVPQDSQGSLAAELDHQSSGSFTGLAQHQQQQQSQQQQQQQQRARPAVNNNPDQSELFPAAEGGGGQLPASDLVIRFDIFIVKVPWVPGIHGLQFRRRSGNSWSYSQLARHILRELRL